MMGDLFGEGRSVTFLRKRCSAVLKRKLGLSPLYVARPNFEYPHKPRGPYDVVLFGDALLLLTNKYLWINKSYRFWVLSEGHRHLIHTIFGLPLEHMAVLPRSLILRPHPRLRELPDLGAECTAVVSSRFDVNKNIPQTLHALAILQKKYSPRLRVAIFAPFQECKKYAPHIRAHRWVQDPIVYGDKGLNWMTTTRLKNPFLVNFSTSIYEDFNVSMAQARQQGWPAVLAHWSVFREVAGPSIRFVPAGEIVSYGKAATARERRSIAESLAEKIASGPTDAQPQTSATLHMRKPKVTPRLMLHDLQRAWSDRRLSWLIDAHRRESCLLSGNPILTQIQKVLQ